MFQSHIPSQHCRALAYLSMPARRLNNIVQQWMFHETHREDAPKGSSPRDDLGATPRGPGDAFGFHAVNVALHATTSAFSVFLFREIFAGQRRSRRSLTKSKFAGSHDWLWRDGRGGGSEDRRFMDGLVALLDHENSRSGDASTTRYFSRAAPIVRPQA